MDDEEKKQLYSVLYLIHNENLAIAKALSKPEKFEPLKELWNRAFFAALEEGNNEIDL